MQSIISTYLTTENIDIIILSGLSLVVLVLLILFIRTEKRMNKMLIGQDAKSIEDSVLHMWNELQKLIAFRKELELYLSHAEKRLKKSVQSIETVRFNPFKGEGVGSNQSFATALINEEGDGVVLSSLYGRDRVSVFSKPIKKLGSEYELSEEEKDALKAASVGILNSKK